ncbi:MAG TPA: hypothetical protein PKC73_10250 [Dermatophilaceae bacterium]|nr:hypothetical protein [Dermatophilaceae bacterium]
MNKYALMNTLFSAIGGAIAGGTIAILVTRKHYIEYADVEIEKVRHHYALIRKDQNVVQILGDMPGEDVNNVPFEETDGAAAPYARAEKIIQELGFRQPEDDGLQTDDDTSGEGEPVRESQSIFAKAVSEDEVGEEIASPAGVPPKKKKIVTGNENPPLEGDDAMLAALGYERISGEPYVISQETMFNDETEWEKPTLSYYKGDDVLIDERGQVLDDTHRSRYVNDRHLRMFGVLSEDENIVYVRSPQISTDFEIILEPGNYKDSMYADPSFDDDRPKRGVRRMRDSD